MDHSQRLGLVIVCLRKKKLDSSSTDSPELNDRSGGLFSKLIGAKAKPSIGTATIPEEFWSEQKLTGKQIEALQAKYEMSAMQTRALVELAPFKNHLFGLIHYPFATRELAAAAAVDLFQKVFKSSAQSNLRDSIELGANLYTDKSGKWRVGTPLFGSGNNIHLRDISTRTPESILDNRSGLHSHPAVPKHIGFSLPDLVGILRSGNKGEFVYDRGRAFLLQTNDQWNSKSALQRSAFTHRLAYEIEKAESLKPLQFASPNSQEWGVVSSMLKDGPVELVGFPPFAGDPLGASKLPLPGLARIGVPLRVDSSLPRTSIQDIERFGLETIHR